MVNLRLQPIQLWNGQLIQVYYLFFAKLFARFGSHFGIATPIHIVTSIFIVYVASFIA